MKPALAAYIEKEAPEAIRQMIENREPIHVFDVGQMPSGGILSCLIVLGDKAGIDKLAESIGKNVVISVRPPEAVDPYSGFQRVSPELKPPDGVTLFQAEARDQFFWVTEEQIQDALSRGLRPSFGAM